MKKEEDLEKEINNQRVNNEMLRSKHQEELYQEEYKLEKLEEELYNLRKSNRTSRVKVGCILRLYDKLNKVSRLAIVSQIDAAVALLIEIPTGNRCLDTFFVIKNGEVDFYDIREDNDFKFYYSDRIDVI